jgi:hypothetical protein
MQMKEGREGGIGLLYLRRKTTNHLGQHSRGEAVSFSAIGLVSLIIVCLLVEGKSFLLGFSLWRRSQREPEEPNPSGSTFVGAT